MPPNIDDYIEIGFQTLIRQGGYGRRGGKPLYPCDGGNCFTGNCDKIEMIDEKCSAVSLDGIQWQKGSAEGSTTHTYSFRNSNLLPGLNSRSSRVTLTVVDKWKASINGENKMHIDVTSTVTSVVVDDVRGGGGGARPTRTMTVGIEGAGSATTRQQVYPVSTGASFNFSDQPITRSFDLGAGETSYEHGGLSLQSWTTNYAGWNTGAEIYRDNLSIGTIFRNNLPNKYTPPALESIVQTPDICEDTVDFHVCFFPPILSGAQLEFYWSYEPNSFPEENKIVIDAPSSASRLCFDVYDLVPSACDTVTFYWKARFVSKTGELEPSDWSSGSQEIMFVPPPWMTVPDITKQECSALGKGDPIDEFDHIVYYQGEKPTCKKGKC